MADAITGTSALTHADQVGQSAAAFAVGLSSVAYVAGLLATAPGGAPNVSNAILAPGQPILGAGTFGAIYDGKADSRTYTDQDTFDFSEPTAPGPELRIGLIQPFDGFSGNPTGFQSTDFLVDVNGATILDEGFTSLTAADNFFSDNVLQRANLPTRPDT